MQGPIRRHKKIWLSPTLVLARVWPSVAFGVPFMIVAVLIAAFAPVDRDLDSIDSLHPSSMLASELDRLVTARVDLTTERQEIKGLETSADVATGSNDARLTQLRTRIQSLDEQIATTTRVSGLSCERPTFQQSTRVEIKCEGTTLENGSALGWLIAGALFSAGSVLVLTALLSGDRLLVPYSAPRSRMLPPLLASVGVLLAPPLILAMVFFERVSAYAVPLAGAPYPSGVAIGGLSLIVSVALLIHVTLTAKAASTTALLLLTVCTATAIAISASLAGTDIAAVGAIVGGVAFTVAGSSAARSISGLGILAIVGIEATAWGIGLATLWASPDAWMWGAPLLVSAVAWLTHGEVEQRLRQLVPQGAFESNNSYVK